MPELTAAQIADLRVLRDHCVALGADLVVIGAIAYQVHFPGELRHTGDIDFAVALDLNEFAELERRLQSDGWIRFANREHRWRRAQGTIMDLLLAGPKLREAKQVTWPVSPFTMSLVGFEHVFTDAQSVEFSPDLTLKVISSTALMLLKLVAFRDDPQRRVKDLDDIRGLLTQYEADSQTTFLRCRDRGRTCGLWSGSGLSAGSRLEGALLYRRSRNRKRVSRRDERRQSRMDVLRSRQGRGRPCRRRCSRSA